MSVRVLTLSALWLFPPAAMVLISQSRVVSSLTMANIQLWTFAFVAATMLISVRWNRQWVAPSTWGWIALGCSMSLATLGFFLKDDRLTAIALCIHCCVWAGHHCERVEDHTHPRSRSMLNYVPILIALLGVPNSLWNLIADWHWNWFSDLAWPALIALETPFLISETGIEFTSVTWSRQTVFGNCFSVAGHVAMCMLWLGLVRRPVWLSPAYAAVAVLWAFLTNLLRFVLLACLMMWAETDGYQGWLMYVTGAAALLGSLLLFIATDKLMGVALSPILSVDSSEKTFNPLIDIWNRHLSID